MSKRGGVLFGLVVLLALAGCASDWEGKYNESTKTNMELSAENEELKQRSAQAQATSEQMAQQLRTQDVELKKARDAADAAAKRAQELQAQTATPKAVPAPSVPDNSALSAVAAELQRNTKGTVTIDKDGNIEITLPSDVTFSPGSADLTEAGKKSLKGLSASLKSQFAPYQIRVEGHTDSTPLKRTKEKYQDNFGLGSARALSVVRYMEADMGIEARRLMSASRGEHEPVADNKSDNGKKQNRRVEVVVVIPREAALSLAK